MQYSGWVRLIQRLPVEIHDKLIVYLMNGVRIKIMKFFRLEDEFLVCQARNTGSNDEGQLMLLPYQQISNLSIDREMSEKQVQDLFDGRASARQFSKSTISDESPMPEIAEPSESEQTEEADSPKAKPPSKSILLARLRERLANHESKG